VSAGTIAVIDYGMGNLRSVSKALEHVAGGKPVS
jgi:glutamine amidotransferase